MLDDAGESPEEVARRLNLLDRMYQAPARGNKRFYSAKYLKTIKLDECINLGLFRELFWWRSMLGPFWNLLSIVWSGCASSWETIKNDINAKKCKTNATEKWTPKNQGAKKCKNNAKKCKSIFIAKIKMQKNCKKNANQFAKKMQEICNNSCICPATFWAIEISIFSAFYTMNRRNNGT